MSSSQCPSLALQQCQDWFVFWNHWHSGAVKRVLLSSALLKPTDYFLDKLSTLQIYNLQLIIWYHFQRTYLVVSNFTVILIIEAIFIIVRSQIEDTLNNFLVSPCLASVRPSSRPAWRRVREGLTGPVLCLTLPEIKTSALLPHTQSPATVQLTVKQDYESQHLLLHWYWVLGDQRQNLLSKC